MAVTELLNRSHQKSIFYCGEISLDYYIQQQASQDVKKKLAVCFVLADPVSNVVKGYYTLSNYSIPFNHLTEKFRKIVPPSYKNIPATLLGRLAVDEKYQNTGLGALILIDALKRCYELSLQLGSMAVIVDPLNTEALNFYEKYGFIQLPESRKLFLSMQTIKQLFE